MDFIQVFILALFSFSMVLAAIVLIRAWQNVAPPHAWGGMAPAPPPEPVAAKRVAPKRVAQWRQRAVCYAMGNRILQRVEPVRWQAVAQPGFAHVQMRLEDRTGNAWTRGYRVCLN